jgi:hypothetical protein
MSKKDNNNLYSILNNAGYFLIIILILTLLVCLHFSFGGFILFACKVAQSNILPTDTKCKPYTENPVDIKPIESNIFVAKPPKSNEHMSQKIKFPYDEINSKNILIDTIRSYKDSPDSFFLTNYFFTIFENLLCFNYYVLNTFFGGTNQFLSESLILILGPLIFPIIFTLLMISNNLYLIYLWFEKMSWFFKKNINNVYEGRKPEWKNVSMLEPVSYFLAFCLIFMFFLLFFVAVWLAFPMVSFFAVIWCTLSILGYKGIMENKETTVMNIISKVFKYHKVTFMSVLTFLIIVSAFSNLGGLGGFLCLLTALALIFRIVPSNIFIPEIPLNLSTLVSNDQAKKTCKAIRVQRTNHGFLYDLLFPQKGGSDLIHEIKKIGKKLNKEKTK